MRVPTSLLQRLRSEEMFLVPFTIPITTLLLIDLNQFILGWNEGAGSGFLFAFVFLILEWYDSRKFFKFRLGRRSLFYIITLTFMASAYFAVVYGFGQSRFVIEPGIQLGYSTRPQILSWMRMWDYTLYALYISMVIMFSFGIKKLRYFPTPIVFLYGMAFILLLDATFPYGSIESLQILMQPILVVTVFLLRVVGVRVDLVSYENLAVWGQKGFLYINMYWQCAGILSMTIYLLVIIILMLKLETPITRKIAYAVFGAIGTFFVNIIRIFLIIYYGAFIDINLRMFHESIGEVLFTIWIVIYLLSVTAMETHLRNRKSQAMISPLSTQ